jgi:hypothetical protein
LRNAVLAHKKILLFNLREMIGDLVEGVLADEEVEFVRTRGDFVSTLVRERPDIAVVQTDRVEVAVRMLLETSPYVRFLVLDGKGRRANLFHVQPIGVALTDTSPRTLRGALQIGEGIA